MSASAASISPAQPSSTPRFVKRSATIVRPSSAAASRAASKARQRLGVAPGPLQQAGALAHRGDPVVAVEQLDGPRRQLQRAFELPGVGEAGRERHRRQAFQLGIVELDGRGDGRGEVPDGLLDAAQLATGVAHDPQQLDPLGTRRIGQPRSCSFQGLRRIRECLRQQARRWCRPGAERTPSGRTGQQRPMPLPTMTSVMPWPPATAALTRAVAKLVPLHRAQPVRLG